MDLLLDLLGNGMKLHVERVAGMIFGDANPLQSKLAVGKTSVPI